MDTVATKKEETTSEKIKIKDKSSIRKRRWSAEAQVLSDRLPELLIHRIDYSLFN